jgi:hypothetical protein
VSYEDLDALARSLPPVDLIAERRRAEEEYAAAWEPSTIPMPEFPRMGVARFRCPRGCAWFHDEDAARDAAEPYALTLPANYTADDVTAAINRNAAARATATRERIERAIAEHDQEAHDGSGPA